MICFHDISMMPKGYYYLIWENGLQPNTLDNIHTQLHSAFQMAVRDELLRRNPSDGVMGEIKKSHIWVKKKRHALTLPQQRAFMNFLESQYEYRGWHPCYYGSPRDRKAYRRVSGAYLGQS